VAPSLGHAHVFHMTAYVLGVLAFAVILFLIAMSRTSTRPRATVSSPALQPEPFLHRSRSVLQSLGFSVESEDVVGHARDWVLLDKRPLVGGRSLARVYVGGESVDAAEVQGVLDSLQGSAYQKAMIFSAGGFTPEARAAAIDSRAELVDPQRLGALSTYLSGGGVTAGALETLVRPGF
jgi:hypothetical protein